MFLAFYLCCSTVFKSPSESEIDMIRYRVPPRGFIQHKILHLRLVRSIPSIDWYCLIIPVAETRGFIGGEELGCL